MLNDAIVSSAHGATLVDERQRHVLDFTSGIGVTNTGHCHPRVVAAAQEQLGRLIHAQLSVAAHRPAVDLTNRLVERHLPRSHDRVMFSTTGAEAVENAIRLVRAATGRPNVIVMQGGYHGRSVGTLALTRSKIRGR